MLLAILGLVGLLCASALAAAALGRSDRAALAVGAGGSVLACGLGVAASLVALLQGARGSLRAPGLLPVGELHVGIDPLSAFFLVCIFTVSGLAALYGIGYLASYVGRRRLAPALAFFNLLAAAMVGVVLARDGILLIVAWEIMSVASFFLVTYEHDRADVRRAGTLYLIASQLGVVFLFILVALAGRAAGSYDFDRLGACAAVPGLANAIFLLALVGFGTKAGFWPLHIWLPDAHPAAPSHVSALMSGVMIKMGIYGLLRVLTFLGPPPQWWGAMLVAVGAISGVAGVLQALAQHDLKRLLAYHSVENIGIIALGIGIGLLAQNHGAGTIAFLGYAGALLHVLNHGLFKGLLFQGAGSIVHATGTRDIDALGGLYRRMPVTGLLFLIGSIAICGLPPLNGFVSEWLIYVGAFRGGVPGAPGWTVASVVTVLALALIGGLAAACFVKAFGVAFLGEARSAASSRAHEAGPSMRLAMGLGALLCLGIGLWPAGALQLVSSAVADLAPGSTAATYGAGALGAITRACAVLIGLVALLALARLALLRRRRVEAGPTWGCGFEAPDARMQYTAASFAQPLLEPFAAVVSARLEREGPAGYFPERARHEMHVGDMAGELILQPAVHRVLRVFSRVRGLQHGRIQLYLAYILVTLVVLLVWQLSGLGGR
ncbi:MAG TPA: proton-conducting transporter membrane subunit [Candidatus Eisenbacteria bacterium]